MTAPGPEFGSITLVGWRRVPARWAFSGNETTTSLFLVAAALMGVLVLGEETSIIFGLAQ